MINTPSQYLKSPKRKAEKGKRVGISDEAKKAYEEMMQKRAAEEEYRRNLGPAAKRV